ncbi:hypothetical protein WICMUC_003139 [Wickerhamomyces mucosus]|uniref:Uncharacterized protein n=1 Tax=Wickerhamomyces mucosus TaxID=1378264 RepID=A0A9P8PLR1_9ASCO|nr:hypothetical protein WICMUC_003139 [Wickerhamomyces mucosus]
MSEFSFTTLSRNESNNTSTETSTNDIHPIELVVQSVIGESLENSYTHLQTLHESQVVLIARLKIMEQQIKKYREHIKMGNELNIGTAQDMITALHQRINKINSKLEVIEKRLDHIEKFKSTSTTEI